MNDMFEVLLAGIAKMPKPVMKLMVEQKIQEYKPVAEVAGAVICELVDEVADNYGNIAKPIAKLQKAQLDAYVEAGFTRSEAMQMIVRSLEGFDQGVKNSQKLNK